MDGCAITLILSLMFTLIAYAAETTQATAESGGFSAIGVNLTSLLFQVINFAILLWLLRRFAYKPILNILQARRETIEESLRNAADIEATKKNLLAEKARILKEAEQQAAAIIARTKEQASETLTRAEEQATTRATQILEQAEATLQQEITQAKVALKQEMAQIVTKATEKLIKQKMDSSADEALITEAIQTSSSL